MKKNMGSIDRLLRMIIAITLVLLYYFEVISGGIAIAAIILAIIFVGTSAIGTCPLYLPFKLSTKGQQSGEE